VGRRGPHGTDIWKLLMWEQQWYREFERIAFGYVSGMTVPPPPIRGLKLKSPWTVKQLRVLQRRQNLWNALIRARTARQVRVVCKRWGKLIPKDLAFFPQRLEEDASDFFAMKKDKAFPRARYSNEARVTFLARGMAGAMLGLRYTTSIGLLRKMKHGVKCECWRCDRDRREAESEAHFQGAFLMEQELKSLKKEKTR